MVPVRVFVLWCAALAIALLPAGVFGTLTISLASNTSAYVVLNDAAVDPFTPTAPVSYEIDADTPILSLLLQPSIPANTQSLYSFQFISGTSSVVSAVSVGGNLTSNAGSFVDDTPLYMDLSFACGDFGSSSITTIVYIDSYDTNTNARLPGSPVLYPFVFTKYCPLNTDCPANCSGHGVCTSTGLNSACVCDAGYEHEPDCSLGFWVDKSAVCVGEAFTINWDAPGGLAYSATKNDWISIGYAQAGVTTWTIDSFNTIIMDPNLPIQLVYAWQFTNGQILVTTDDFHSGSLQFDFRGAENSPGVYPISFNLNNLYVARALVTVELYDKFDRVLCPIDANATAPDAGVPIYAASSDADCGGAPSDIGSPRGAYANGTCHCNSPYFGARCGSGCTGSVTYAMHGRDFTSSVAPVSGQTLEYSNYQTCYWVLAPPPLTGSGAGTGNSSGIWLQFTNFQTEATYDFVTVYRGTDVNDVNSIVGQFSGSYTPFALTLNSPTVTVKFLSSEWNPSGWSGPGIPFLFNGFAATFHGLGCPAGSQHVYAPATAASNTGAGTWSCDLCSAGKLSTVQDSDNCTLCTAGTFSPAGATSCSSCGLAEYQPLAGQSACFDCATDGYPAPFCVSPSRLTATEKIGLITVSAAMTAGVGVTFVVIFLFRKARLVVPSTPSLLLCILLGLGGFLCSGIVIVQDASRTLCSLQIWMWNLSFHLVVSSLVLKSYRLHRIFKAHALKMTIIYDWHLWLVLAGLLIADSVVLGVWEGVSPPELTLDGRCSSGGDTGFILSMILIACKALMLVFGMWIAYQIRDIPAQFNESKQMMLGLYNLAFLCVLFVGMIYALNTTFSGAQIVILEFVGLVFGSVTTLAILFGPLLYGLWTAGGDGVMPFRGSSGAGKSAAYPNRNSVVSVDTGGRPHPVGSGRGGGGTSPLHSVVDNTSNRTGGATTPVGGAAASAAAGYKVAISTPKTSGGDIMKRLNDKLDSYLHRRRAAAAAVEAAREQVRSLDADICRVQNEIEYYTVNPDAIAEYRELQAALVEVGGKQIREQIRAAGYHAPLSPQAAAATLERKGSVRSGRGVTVPPHTPTAGLTAPNSVLESKHATPAATSTMRQLAGSPILVQRTGAVELTVPVPSGGAGGSPQFRHTPPVGGSANGPNAYHHLTLEPTSPTGAAISPMSPGVPTTRDSAVQLQLSPPQPSSNLFPPASSGGGGGGSSGGP